ncbi:hypothetical protein D3C75_1240990 [compost metagenome]
MHTPSAGKDLQIYGDASGLRMKQTSLGEKRLKTILRLPLTTDQLYKGIDSLD